MGYMADGYPMYGECPGMTTSWKYVYYSTPLPYGVYRTQHTVFRKIAGQSGCDTSHYEYNAGSGRLDKANGFFFDTMTVINGQPFYGYNYFFTEGEEIS